MFEDQSVGRQNDALLHRCVNTRLYYQKGN